MLSFSEREKFANLFSAWRCAYDVKFSLWLKFLFNAFTLNQVSVANISTQAF